MVFYSWIVENRELLKFLFTLVVVFTCFIIVLKTHRMFKLSYHEGIRYFRNAFFFYGIAFLARYMTNPPFYLINIMPNGIYSFSMMIFFEFFMIMAGFFLFYSLLYKNFEAEKTSFSSLLNIRIFMLYSIALIISILDALWGVYYFMFFSQIIIFSFAGGIAFEKYGLNERREGFLKLYLMVIFLNLLTWILNLIIASFFGWNQVGVIGVYALDIIIFLMFLYGIIKVTRK